MRRPAFKTVSEEMRSFCFLLGEELLRWPGVTTRPMFGMRAFYRGGTIFAALPDKKAIQDANAIMYKLPGAEMRPGHKWNFFSIAGDSDLKSALAILAQAYERAQNQKQPRKRAPAKKR